MPTDDINFEENKYFLNKLFVSYVFSDNIKGVLNKVDDDNCIYREDALLRYLEQLINKNAELEFLDDYVKNNIREILIFLRCQKLYRQREDYNDIVSRLNDMLIKVNKSSDINASEFYYNEVLKRNALSHHAINMINRGRFEIDPHAIRETMATDVLLLLFFSMNDEEYEKCAENNFENEYVVCSLKRMIDENPDIFLDDQTYKRVREILKFNLSYILGFFYEHQFYKNNLMIYKKLRKIKRDKL